jgi:hypothetical protein
VQRQHDQLDGIGWIVSLMTFLLLISYLCRACCKSIHHVSFQSYVCSIEDRGAGSIGERGEWHQFLMESGEVWAARNHKPGTCSNVLVPFLLASPVQSVGCFCCVVARSQQLVQAIETLQP